MKSGITSLLAALSAVVVINAARAEDKPAAPAAAAAAPAGGKPQAWQASCEADIQKLCKGVNGSGIPECLAKNEKDLSEACTKAFLLRYKVMQICKPDIEKLCREKVE